MANKIIEHLPKFITEQGKILADAGVERAKGEIEIILCFLLECDRLNLYLHGESLFNDSHLERFNQIIKRRLTREPLQYILEESWFFGRKFFVSPAVMVPTPETELLCDTAIGFIKQFQIKQPKIIDLGVGSGVISCTLALEVPNSQITALDVSAEALDVAKKNAKDLKADSNMKFIESDYFTHVDSSEKYDLILANPPYISEDEYKELPPEVLADPKVSLTSANDGLGAVEIILRDAPNYLAPNGRIMFEIGYNQADRVAKLTENDDRFTSIVILKDLNDIDRVVILNCS
ncbi:MAG: peptide chain release factor N(5)-glutamine methyltransferase [Calditrichaeota bacterium]|nr:MAG: peptide chain release factor N(5)-glutamine methyltransferase [Calditrichota bacterium]